MRIKNAVAVLFGGLVLASCNSVPVATSAKGWNVYKGGKLVEWIDDKPGLLMSLAAPPPAGTPPARSAFLTAHSKDVWEEDPLRRLFEQSKSFAGYVELLRKNGYTVSPATDGQ